MNAPDLRPQNDFGRPFDEFDAIKMRLTLRDCRLILPGQGYAVYSMSGKPLCGLVPDQPAHPPKSFINTEWK